MVRSKQNEKLSLSLNLINKQIHSDILNDIQLDTLIEHYPHLLTKLFSQPYECGSHPCLSQLLFNCSR